MPNGIEGKTQPVTWGAIVLAVLGLLTAIVTNLDRIAYYYEKLTGTGTLWDNRWTGVHQYPEFEQGTDKVAKIHIQHEFINIHGTRSKVSGVINNSQLNPPREWDVEGTFRNDILILVYIEKKGQDKSSGTLVLEPVDANKKTFIGFWLGVHEDANRLVACPYIMTAENQTTIEQQYDGFLHKPCIVR